MFTLKLIFLIAFIRLEGVCSQQCNDCINYERCPEALHLATNVRTAETRQLFRHAICGYDFNETTTPKVCCSMFSPTNETGKTDSTPEDNSITNHVNLNLLPEECGIIRISRLAIVHAGLYQFPWMALIAHESSRNGVAFKCGGSIINKRYVLTAAHCVHGKNIAGVRVGEYDLENQIDCEWRVCEDHIQDVQVEHSVIHEGYNELPHVVNDIALLRLADDIDFNHRNVHRICLPLTNELRHRVLSNETAIVTGWGLDNDREPSSVLRQVNMPIYDTQQCNSFYNRFNKLGEPNITTEHLCVGSRHRDTCIGDSGGPLILEARYSNTYKYVQYGVKSRGTQSCGSDYPAVYTDVTKYINWILDNISP